MKKFVDPGNQRGVTETELSASSVATDTPKEGVILDQDRYPVDGIQQNSQTQSVPLPLSPAQEKPKSLPVRKRETAKWMKDCLPTVTELLRLPVCHVIVVHI